ncbi:MAG: replicative DNA helicase [Bacteroidota bacterium]
MKKEVNVLPVSAAEGARPVLEKNAPHVVHLEETLLGALLTERDVLADIIDTLTPACFYREAHALIYEAILHLFNKNEGIDPRMVVNQLRKNGTLAKVGGAAYISMLASSVASAVHIEDHAAVIRDYSMRRDMIRLSHQMNHEARDLTIETNVLLDRLEQKFFDISETGLQQTPEAIKTLLADAFKELEAKKEKGTAVTGVPSGFTELDRILLGWQKAEFVVLAARPGMGKTALMLSLLRNAAMDYKTPVAFFSLEMNANILMQRMIAAETAIEGYKIKKGAFEDYECEQLYHKAMPIGEAPIYIDDSAGLSLFELRAKCRRLKVQKDIRIVFVDYLQLMVNNSLRAQGNREQEIAAISRGLKCIAKELGITMIVASQLSRAVETRGGDKRPQLSDIRESGAIEQDADVVLFPYRPAYYGITQDEEGNDTRDLAEIIIAKHRNGPTGRVFLRFISSITKFTDAPPAEDVVIESKINTLP